MPPWMIGCWIPNSSVIAVFTSISRYWPVFFKSQGESFLPLLAEGTDFQFEGPGALRLLVELPIGARHRSGRHQQIRIVERARAERLDATLANPFGIHAGIDDEMRDMDVLRTE